MPSNFVTEKPAPRKFKLRADDMFIKRDLPEKYLGTLIVLGRLAQHFEEIEPTYKGNATLWNIQYTVNQATKVFEEGTGYGMTTTRAFLPKVIRHLMVQINRNHGNKDAMIEAFRNFLNDERLTTLLDNAWKN